MKHSTLALLSAFLFFSSCSNVGETAPSFEFKTIDGVEINSDDLKGKIIVVNIWATWCPTCIQEIPALNRLQAKYASDTSIMFLALCDDNVRDMRVVFERFPFNYIHVADAELYTNRLQTRVVKTYPQNLILDGDFQIVYEVSDGVPNIFQAIDNRLVDLIFERDKKE